MNRRVRVHARAQSQALARTHTRVQVTRSFFTASVFHRALPEADRADTHTSAGTHSNQKSAAATTKRASRHEGQLQLTEDG